jgi:transcription-repair coupling factor (superfamily II helicase)
MSEEAVLSLFREGHRQVAFHGWSGSYLALVLARLARAALFPRPLVVLTRDEETARDLARDLVFFLGRRAPEGSGPGSGEARAQAEGEPTVATPVMHLPSIETSPYTEISFDRPTMMHRMATLFRLSQGYSGEVLVLSAPSLRRKVMRREAFGALCDLIVAEEEFDRDAVVRRLLACGFTRTQVVEDPGTFAVRGAILDLYPPLSAFPVRLEFFGDLVESIRLFDPSSQRTLRAISEVMIHPVRETIPTGTGGAAALRARILAAADAASHPSSRTRALLEELESGREFFGIEALTPAFHEGLAPLSTYLPQAGLWAVMDPEAVEEVLAQEDGQGQAAHSARFAEGRITFPPEAFFSGVEELRREVGEHARLEARVNESEGGAAVRCATQDNADLVADLRRARADRGDEILKTLAARLRRWQAEGRRVVVAAGGVGQLDRLDALLRGHGIHARLEREVGVPELLLADPPTGAVELRAGDLSSGFRLPTGLVVLTEEEIFGPKARRRPAQPPGPGVGDLRDLAEGDYVVHASHGVGRYLGLVKLEIRGVPADFLLLEYQGGDRLYLPVYRMNQVHKWSAGDGVEPKLDRLGGLTWAKKTSKVRTEVRQLAEELLQLYAQRAALQGHAFGEPDATYRELEATFPFTETPDQLKAVDEVMRDLAAPRPMDRLICGDVGFGKTEVALRAAFLVAVSGKQVALLAPTTVLVEQHGRTFNDRLGPYAVRVETLSRFRKPQEIRHVLADLHTGRIDIIIGTHRLLSPDVRFRDLGLLIIDEEHRFGVAHKERLKRLRTQVDVLTMTATPIPRTLQMGLVGMREISIMATPPVDRLAVRTFVSRYEDHLVAEGIRRELDRGGQVFFVHNRVETIDEWAGRVSALVPEARIAVAHGQMDAARLERAMVDFVAAKVDVLVCTAIIESGLDIPRANTMFINRADCFGLAQLYQLRGRIGRSRHRAFCYLLVPGIESMTGEARQRLATLQRFTELGSGFSVASHDLEIRGAGDLLGARQSGHIAAVGFETYARILDEAVAELKGQPIHRETDPEISAHVPAFIPDDYVEDTGQRLDLYQRLSTAAADEDAIHGLQEEMRDRYGELPPEAIALGELMVVKGLAQALGATVVDLAETRLSLTLSEVTPLRPTQVVKLVSDRASGFRLTPEMRLIRTLRAAEQEHPLGAARKILHDLLGYANRNYLK